MVTVEIKIQAKLQLIKNLTQCTKLKNHKVRVHLIKVRTPTYESIFLPPNIWVVSIRILNGVAGHGRCRPVGRSVSRSFCGLTPSLIHV